MNCGYKLIRTRFGGNLLMLNGYTYSKHSRSSNYYCSKKAHGCRAKVKLDHFGMIASESPCHNHDPPKYTITASVSNAAYKMIPTRRGKHLLIFGNYTFSQMNYTNNFYCSKKDSGCKARVKLSFDGSIQHAFTEHTHPPPKPVDYEIIKSQRGKQLLLINGYTFSRVSTRHWVCSTKFRDCKARLKMDEDGNIISLFNEHCHPRRKFARTVTGDLVRV
ncbi:unnamed protein product [Parnassius mnemosyne]|uniref:FLYWCH-type domain-containing protein n=1 Tax=Parnassius mnemosyne TaxID=213953 RepID=A0AAV1KB39_9NEOP